VHKNVAHCVAVWALILVSIHLLTPGQAAGQATASIQEQLEAQYPLAKINNAGGCSLSNGDAVKHIVIQKPGLVAVPASSFAPKCASHYKDGRVSPPGTVCTGNTSAADKFNQYSPWKIPKVEKIPQRQQMVELGKGDAVYATAFEVNEQKAEVKLSIGYCSGDAGQAMAYKGEVIFQLKSELFKNRDINRIEDTITELFAFDSGDANNQQNAPAPDSDTAQAGTPPSAAAPAPPTVTNPRTTAIVTRAVEIASYLAANRFDLVYQNYTDEMKRIGSTERMSRNWGNQVQHLGPFVRIVSAEKNPDSNVVNVVCALRDGQVNVEVVVVDPSMQINGLWFQPAPGRHWPPQAPVQ
jgi:uncharacterized protein DUF3887